VQEILIVDGYNIVNDWPELVELKRDSFEHARDKLLDILVNYQGLTGYCIVVVFDAHLVRHGTRSREKYSGVEVIFTQEGETADSCIERLVTLIPEEIRVTVATSDWAQQRLVMGKGALRLSARELFISIKEVEKRGQLASKTYQKRATVIDDVIRADLKSVLERWRRRKK
jgi:predicted RNA-binding protein with PIN domain